MVNDIFGNDSAILYKAKPYDILFTEIMADPLPEVLLPGNEYLELFNRTGYKISIEGWTLEAGTKSYTLAGIVQPDSYLIITYSGAKELFIGYGEVLGLFSSTSTLTNTGLTLILKDNHGEIIDAVEYSDSWYRDEFKGMGGWSLERIDVSNVCTGFENWIASVSHAGGTPGRVNSVSAPNPDLELPYVSGVQIVSGNSINIIFNESVRREFFYGESPFKITGSSNSITGIYPALPFYDACRIELRDSIMEGQTYEMMANENFSDCSGNKYIQALKIRFGIPVLPQFTDIILTEVLYSPYPGCPEFIEIYSNSDQILDLSGLIIGLDYNDGMPVKREYLINNQQLLFPGDYLVLVSDPKALKNFYHIRFPERLFTMKNLPSLRNEGGCIELSDRSFQIIDLYCYSKNDHYSLLDSDAGVSLERMNIDRRPGYESSWHSASSVSGFATPGYENSQALSLINSDESLSIEPGTFTPDNDGKDDVVVISYKLKEEGYTGNIIIFNASGLRVINLAMNESLGFGGSFVWDGKNFSGIKCQTGIYLVYFDAFNLKGKRIRKKKTVLLVNR